MSALIEEVFAEKFAKAREEGIEQERASFQKKTAQCSAELNGSLQVVCGRYSFYPEHYS